MRILATYPSVGWFLNLNNGVVDERSHIDGCMGVCVYEGKTWVGTRHGFLICVETQEILNANPNGVLYDVAVINGNIHYVDTRLGCVSSLDGSVVWHLPTNTGPVEDEGKSGHMNGMAVREDRLAFVSSFNDGVNDWRRTDVTKSGIVWDVVKNEPVITGLYRPHRPIWHDGKLWVMDSGTGTLVCKNGSIITSAFNYDGFPKAFSFIDDHTVLVGVDQENQQRPNLGEPRGINGWTSVGNGWLSDIYITDLVTGTSSKWTKEPEAGDMFAIHVLFERN